MILLSQILQKNVPHTRYVQSLSDITLRLIIQALEQFLTLLRFVTFDPVTKPAPSIRAGRPDVEPTIGQELCRFVVQLRLARSMESFLVNSFLGIRFLYVLQHLED